MVSSNIIPTFELSERETETKSINLLEIMTIAQFTAAIQAKGFKTRRVAQFPNTVLILSSNVVNDALIDEAVTIGKGGIIRVVELIDGRNNITGQTRYYKSAEGWIQNTFN